MPNQLISEKSIGQPVRYLGLTPEWARTICWKAVEGCPGAKHPERFDSICSRDYESNLRCNYKGKI